MTTESTAPGLLSDSPLRSVIKAVTYRVFGTASTAVIAYIVTGQIGSSLTIGALEFVSKFGIYYLHERAWSRVPLGTIRKIYEREPEESSK